MSKWFKGNGFLSDEGKEALKNFREAMEEILASEEVEEMKVSELQTLQSNMSKMVGDAVSNVLQAREEIEADKRSNPLWKLTDEEFYASLKEKYGEKWMLVGLTKEEFARCPRPSRKQLREAWEQGAADAASIVHPQVRIDPGLRFR
jgi:hypothetical protein